MLLAVYPILSYYGLNFLPLPLQLEFFPLDSFQGLLIYPLVYFVYPPLYALVITICLRSGWSCCCRSWSRSASISASCWIAI